MTEHDDIREEPEGEAAAGEPAAAAPEPAPDEPTAAAPEPAATAEEPAAEAAYDEPAYTSEPAAPRPGAVVATSSGSRRLLPGWNRPDPRRRPRDPAGTFPRHEPDDLLPVSDERLVIHSVSPLAPGVGAAASAPVAVRGDGPLPEPPQAARFQFALGALIAVAVAGVLLLVIALVDNSSTSGRSAELSGPRWSTWAPYNGSVDGATQIADHVGGEYKGPDNRQLVAITGGPLEVAGLPLTVALRQTPAQGGKIQLFDGQGVLYRMCGLGEKCAIAAGKPSEERHLLLRREALELALYSFRYLKGVSQVVVFMPPRKGEDPTQALFFRPQDVARELGQPLSTTLSPKTPTVSSMTSSLNAKLVDELTYQSLFKFSLTQANQDARAFLVLDKLS